MKSARKPTKKSVDAAASQWITQNRVGMTEEQRGRFMAWLGECPEHAEAFERISKLAAVFDRVRQTGSATSIVAELGARSRRRRSRRRLMGIGVAAILVAGVFMDLRPIMNLINRSSPERVAQFDAIRRLPDGSIIELKDGAEIVVQFDSAFRRVSLVRGEALFRVEHDQNRPFVVSARGVEVRAVGTAFNVKVDAGTIDVLVTEGKVRVDDAVRGLSLLPLAPHQQAVPFAGAIEPVLIAGQEAVVDIERPSAQPPAVRVIQLGSDEISRTLSWRIPRFDFDGVELGDAVERINRLNRVQIVLADDSLSRLRLGGTFSPDDPETFSRLVAATFTLKIERRGADSIVLRRSYPSKP